MTRDHRIDSELRLLSAVRRLVAWRTASPRDTTKVDELLAERGDMRRDDVDPVARPA